MRWESGSPGTLGFGENMPVVVSTIAEKVLREYDKQLGQAGRSIAGVDRDILKKILEREFYLTV